MHKTAVVIAGPTGAGKTKLAFELARRVRGEVINLDKIYLFKHFPISSGLSDTLKEQGVRRHFYEILEPEEAIIPPAVYAKMVREKCAEILDAGRLPIIEGGSTTYLPALMEENKKDPFCAPIIGLRFPAQFNLEEKIVLRIELALKEGLLEEVKNNLPQYRNTLAMSDCHAIVPLVRYLDGKITLEDAKKEILERALGYINRQMGVFTQYPEITWAEYTSETHSRILDDIIKEITK